MRYLVKQKYWSINDKFNVTDEAGNSCYQVEGQFFSIGKKLWLKDMAGNEIFFLKQHAISFTQKWDIMRGGNVIGTFKGRLIHPPFLRIYKMSGEFGDIKIKGSMLAFNFKVLDNNNGGVQIGSVSKKILKIADTYVVESMDDNMDPAAMIASALIIDALHHKKH